MEADMSNYNGDQTTQDPNSIIERSSADFDHNQYDFRTTASTTDELEHNKYYHKNEITMPISFDESDSENRQNNIRSKEPHYMSTINLNIRQSLENHSNLEDMSKNYRGSNYLNNGESPINIKKGIQNYAFDDDEQHVDVKSTFDHSRPYNGDVARELSTNSNSNKPMTEIVDLELINLKPARKDAAGLNTNGINGVNEIPIKKEDDAEIGNPYDEYFVPVNEHRKYMRGEKLYVTMDKRNKKNRNKCLCWTICFCIVVAALLIGILTAVGAIGIKEPIKEITARHFGGNEEPVNEASILGNSYLIKHTSTNVTTLPVSSSTISTWLPSTDTSLIKVPRALESQVVLKNIEYTPLLADKNNSEYQTLEKSLEEQLRRTLFSNDVLKYGSADIVLKIISFMPGSVVVTYRIAWTFKSGIHNAKDPISAEVIKRKLNNVVERNNGFMGTYHIAPSNHTSTKKIIDLCQTQNNNCEHLCMFDYENNLDFFCTCPEGKLLASNGKNCGNENFSENVIPISTQAANAESSTESEKVIQFQTTINVNPSYPLPTTNPNFATKLTESEPELPVVTRPSEKQRPSVEPELSLNSKTTHDFSLTTKPYSKDESVTSEASESYMEINKIESTTNFNQLDETTPLPISESSKQKSPSKKEQQTILSVSNTHIATSEKPLNSIKSIITKQMNTTTMKESQVKQSSQNMSQYGPNNYETNDTTESIFLSDFYTEHQDNNDNTDYRFVNEEATYLEPSTEKEPPEHKSEKMIASTTYSGENDLDNINAKVIKLAQNQSVEAKSVEPVNAKAFLVPVKIETLPNATTVTINTETNLINDIVTTTSTFNLLSEVNIEDLKGIKVVTPEAEVVLPLASTPESNEATTSGIENVSNNDRYQMNSMLTTEAEILFNTNNSEIGKQHSSQVFQTEFSPIEHNMSPFLPEIENDTLISILHSDENYIEHPTTHYSIIEPNETKPFDLNNDQLNHTNPFDPDPTDASDLKVISLKNEENEIIKKESKALVRNDTAPVVRQDHIFERVQINSTNNQFITSPEQNKEHKDNDSTTFGGLKELKFTGTLPNKNESFRRQFKTVDIPPTNIIHEKNDKPTKISKGTSEEDSLKKEDISLSSNKVITENSNGNEITLSPEIFNNVHSNSFFNKKLVEQYSNNKQMEHSFATTTISTLRSQFHAIVDKIDVAETTTAFVYSKIIDNETPEHQFVDNNSTNSPEYQESKEPVTEEQNLEISTLTSEVPDTELFNMGTEAVTLRHILNSTFDLANETAVSQNKMKKLLESYEVMTQTVDDLTTTEKLSLTPKSIINFTAIASTPTTVIISTTTDRITSTAIGTVLEYDEEEDLSVGPVESFNNISVEEQSVMDKFRPVVESQLEKTMGSGKVPIQSDNDYKKKSFNHMDIRNSSTKLAPSENANGDKKNMTSFGFARCATGQFQCINGTSTKDRSNCISENDRCDSVFDCSDGSDEIKCVEEGCINNFKCHSGQCLKRHFVCDGIVHCNDGSDEINCDSWICNFDEFACKGDKRCLPLSWKCDGRFQCNDKSDEEKCHMTQCQNNLFHCSEQDSCIPESWRCDGIADCANDEDEKLCNCTDEQFKCQTGGGCIGKNLRCDGIPQCADHSDEWNCLILSNVGNTSQILQVNHQDNGTLPICLDESNWNKTYADRACQTLGYSESIHLTPIETPASFAYTEYYSLHTNDNNYASLLTQLVKSKNKNCTQIVTLKCREFSCKSRGVGQISEANIGRENNQEANLTLLYNKKKNIYCICTLIAPMWAITSYSCLINQDTNIPDSSEWVINLGETKLMSLNNNITDAAIDEIVPHPQAKYLHHEFINDAALIKLKNPFSAQSNVTTVCLPSKDIGPKQMCVLPGYETDESRNSVMKQYFHYSSVAMLNNSVCNSTNYYNGLLSSGKLCAEYTDLEKCYNVKGAPLLCISETNKWELHGLLSHHVNCRISKHPIAFSSLINKKLINWITNTVGQTLEKSLTKLS